MKTELYFYLSQAIRSKIGTVISTSAAFLLLLAVPSTKNEGLKVLLLASSLAAATSASISGENLKETDAALNDYAASTGLNRQRKLLHTPFFVKQEEAPTSPLTPPKKEEVKFDLSSIGNDRDAFPNVFILGAPGSGKTTLAEYLGILLKSDFRFAVHPHAKPTDFKGFDRIFGGGRNIGTPEDESLSWNKIEKGEVVPTVAQVFMALHQLMQDRYVDYYQGKEDFPTIDVYFDEMPAIATELGSKFLNRFLPSLIMECRKVGIRLWFLSQALQVKALGLSGISDLREGATVIRLGKLALNEAHTLTNNKRLEVSSLLSLKQESRPALVDDIPAHLPGVVEMKAAIAGFVEQKTAAKPAQKKKRKNPLTT